MIDYKIQSLRQNIKRNFHNKNCLLKVCLISLFLLLLPLCAPLYADSHYLFPSDLIDQTEQANYDVERANRYASQREWQYPEKSSTNARGTIQPGETSTSYYPDTRHEYDGFNAKSYTNYRPVDKLNRMLPPKMHREINYNSDGANYYSENEYENHYGEDNLQRRMPANTLNSLQGNTYRSHSGLLFPGDVEQKKHYRRENNKQLNYQTQNQSQYKMGQAQVKEQIRYIPVPVPVYRVPGTLPGTVPGVVTPSNMVPGYSHLSPNDNYSSGYNYGSDYYYNQGLGQCHYNRHFNRNPLNHSLFNTPRLTKNGSNNFFGQGYNPLDSFGTFPSIGNPFYSLYNNNGNSPLNSMPFTNLNFMSPGQLVPDMFSTPE